MNFSKSELFPLNKAANDFPLQSLPFKIAKHSFIYLGVQVTDKSKDLYKANFIPLLKHVQEDFDCWSMFKLSLVARTNSVKTNTLPKFLYLFQCVSIFLPQIFFRRIDTIISKFPGIHKQFLQRPKALGGMALPNLRFYYWAAHLRIIQSWLQFDSHHSMPVWLKLEAVSCHPVSLAALVHSAIKSPSSSYTKNVIVKNL